MDRSKVIAVLTGAIALLLGVGYLVLVQLLDFRGEMLPAPSVGFIDWIDWIDMVAGLSWAKSLIPVWITLG